MSFPKISQLEKTDDPAAQLQVTAKDYGWL